MIIIKLTLHKGNSIYFLLNQIACFYPHSYTGSCVRMSNGDEIEVKEDIEEIRSLISK